jgi:hypothetical protein
MIAPIVASQSQDVAFIVLMAGTGVKGEDVLTEQGKFVLGANGSSEELIEENTKVQKTIFEVLKSTADYERPKSSFDSPSGGTYVRDSVLGGQLKFACRPGCAISDV